MHYDIAVVVCFLTVVWREAAAVAPKETVFQLASFQSDVIPGNKLRCYDCSYHYSRGTYTDCRYPGLSPWGPRQVECDGQCFVRRDPNGSIYRGCANADSFPFLKKNSRNCSHQGEPRSLWWFCTSSDCNNVDIVKICSDRRRLNPPGHRFSICDGSCRDPSGIYPDPFNVRRYIQCGGGKNIGQGCTCCREYRFTCPENSSWQPVSRQCLPIPDGAVFGEGYKYGFI